MFFQIQLKGRYSLNMNDFLAKQAIGDTVEIHKNVGKDFSNPIYEKAFIMT